MTKPLRQIDLGYTPAELSATDSRTFAAGDVRVLDDRVVLAGFFKDKEIPYETLDRAVEEAKGLRFIQFHGASDLIKTFKNGEAPRCKVLVEQLAAAYRTSRSLRGYTIRATVLGGTSRDFPAHVAAVASFDEERVCIRAESSRSLELSTAQIRSLKVEGPGLVKTGGGVVGGGFGVDGAIAGIAIAAALNALTTTSRINTLIYLNWTQGEIFLHTDVVEPEPLRIALSATFAAVEASKNAAPLDSDADWISRLERLAALHSTGSLTDEEFTAAKARLLRTQRPQ
jgi:hypothetical protein